MKNYSKKSIISHLGILGFSSSLLFCGLSANRAKAMQQFLCPESGSANATVAYINNLDSSNPDWGNCLTTPDKFELTIYEMGLCTSDPITGAKGSKAWDNTNCVTTMLSASGVTVDLAPGSASSKQAALPSASTRPPSNTYTHAFILISNKFKLKGSYTLADGTRYYSTQGEDEWGLYGKPVIGSAAAQEHGEELDMIGGADEEGNWTVGDSSEMDYTEMTGGGKVAAILLKTCDHVNNKCIGTTPKVTSQAEPERLFAVFETNSGSPVTISDSTQGLEVELSVKNVGYSVGTSADGGSGTLTYFGSAPFKPKFTTF